MKFKKSTWILTFLLISILAIILISDNKDYLLNWLGIYIYIYMIFTWQKETSEPIFSMYTIFCSFLFLFNYGQFAIQALNIDIDRGIGVGKELLYGSGLFLTEKQLIISKIYTCVYFLTFHYGALYSSKKLNIKFNCNNNQEDMHLDYKSLYLTGVLLSLVVIPVTLYYKFVEFNIARVYGYNALYYGSMSTQQGYVQIIIYMFFPVLVALLIGSKYSEKIKKRVYIIFFIYMILSLLSGDRGGWLYSLIILIWMENSNKKISLKKAFLYIFIAVIGLYVLKVVTSIRDNGGLNNLNIKMFLDIFKGGDNPIVDAFFEMGGSFKILAFFVGIGRHIYPYKNTYVVALLGGISTKLLKVIGVESVLIANWLSNDFLNLNYGYGFSMFGEAYVNGGFVGGIVYIFIIGFLIGRILIYPSQHNRKNSPLRLFLSISIANVIMGFPRADSYLIVKEIIYGVCVLAIFTTMIKKVYYKEMYKL